jgi:2-keto-3-deoxy-L-rhamnonate aldolase RhmA
MGNPGFTGLTEKRQSRVGPSAVEIAVNPFRQLIKAAANHPPVGTWILSASAIVAEAVGHAGFDWAVVDMEHAPLDLMDLVHLLQAIGNTRSVPVVRVPWNEPVIVKRVLDAGATTLMFPFIETAADARRAVAATRYPPDGVRGMAGMSRASGYGTKAGYAASANREIGVIVQLETPDAIRVLEDIAAVDGVDALFVGPADLSAHMGFVGQPTHAAVCELMTAAARRARGAGMAIGTVGNNPEMVARQRAMGYDFVAIASDLGLLMRGAQAAIQALRGQDRDAHVHSLTGGTEVEKG